MSIDSQLPAPALEGRLYTAEQVAKAISPHFTEPVAAAFVYSMRRRKKIPEGVKLGRLILWTEDEVRQAVEAARSMAHGPRWGKTRLPVEKPA